MRAPVLTLAILLFAACAAAQTAEKPITVSGTVTDSATSAPLPRALVTLGGNPSRFAFTDGSGHFEIQNVKPGRYFVSIAKPGYYDPNSSGSGTHINYGILITSTSAQLNMKLIPAASISGRVLTSSGEPVEGASVQIFYATVNDGRLIWNPNQAASTGDDGTYEIPGLVPGRYRVRLNQMQVPGFDLPLRAARLLPREMYPPQFYPNASDEAGAQAIQLEAGAHGQADFTVSAVPTFRISGTATSPDRQFFNVSLETASGTTANPIADSYGMPNGRWSLDAPAGSWRVVATTQGNPLYYAERTVDVRGGDISNINLVLQPVSGIPFRVADPNAAAASFVQVLFTSGDSIQSLGADSPGGLAQANLQPGAYHVSALVPANNACIDTVISGNADLSREDLVVSAGATPPAIDISLRSDCAALTVDIDAAEQRTLTVIVVPDNRVLEPIKMDTQSGTVQFAKLSPGEYMVYAFSSIDDLEYANPDVMRAYSGQSITVAPNEKTEVKVAVIERSGP